MDGAQERGVAAAATPRAYPAASPALPPRPILSPRTGPHNGAAAASATSRSRRAAYVAPFEPPSAGGGVRLPGAAQAPAFPPPPDFPPLPPRPPSSPPPLVTAVLRSAAARVGTHQHVPQCRMVGGGGAVVGANGEPSRLTSRRAPPHPPRSPSETPCARWAGRCVERDEWGGRSVGGGYCVPPRTCTRVSESTEAVLLGSMQGPFPCCTCTLPPLVGPRDGVTKATDT